MKFDDVVIGAGVSGMTAAILLAQQGRKVALLETAATIAPTIRGFVRSGVYFDTGFHYVSLLEDSGPLSLLLDRLGLLSQIKLHDSGHVSGDVVHHERLDYQFRFSCCLRETMQQLIDAFPDDAAAIETYLKDIDGFLNRLRQDLFAAVLDPSMLTAYGGVSVKQYFQEHFRSPVVQTLLTIHSALYDPNPIETSMKYHMMITGGYYERPRQIVGGGQALAAAFDSQLRHNGVEIFTGCRAERVLIDANRAVEAIAVQDRETIECSNCIYSGHLRLLPEILPEQLLRPTYRKRICELQDTGSALVLYCRDGLQAPPACSGNYILVRDSFPSVLDRGDPTESSFFVSQSVAAPGNRNGVSIICPWDYRRMSRWEDTSIGRRGTDYYAWKRQTGERILMRVKAMCPDRFAGLELLDAASPLTFRDYMGAPNGCLYGVKHRLEDMPFFPQTRVPGLFLSGQATLATGFMGAMLSGFISAAAITNENYRRILQA